MSEDLAAALGELAHRLGLVTERGRGTLGHLHRACTIDGIDERGLDRTEQAYLRVLDEASGPVRLGVMADRLGHPARTLSGCVEPYPIRLGLISRSEEGRQLTEAGAGYVQFQTRN